MKKIGNLWPIGVMFKRMNRNGLPIFTTSISIKGKPKKFGFFIDPISTKLFYDFVRTEFPQMDRSGKNNSFYGKNHKEETKQKISKIHKGKTISEKQRREHSKAMSGKNHPNYGKHLSQESRQKMSESRKGIFLGKNNPMYGIKGKLSPNYGKKLSEEHKNNNIKISYGEGGIFKREKSYVERRNFF